MKLRFMRKMIFAFTISTLLFLSFFQALRVGEASPETARVYVDPPISVADIDETFTVNITVAEVTDLHAWEFELSFDESLLYINDTMVAQGDFFEGEDIDYFSVDTVTVPGTVYVQCELLGATASVSGNGTLANITFLVQDEGECDLDLTEEWTTLWDASDVEIERTLEGGAFYPPYPTASFTYEHETILGKTIVFNASGSFDYDGDIVSYMWDFGDGNITDVSDPIITHAYAAAGIYTVTLNVTDNDGLTDTATKTVTLISIYVDPSTSTEDLGENFTININVANVSAERGVSAWEVKLSWDPDILYTEAGWVKEGNFLKDAAGPAGTYFVASVSLTKDRVGASCLLKNPVTATGSGTLANITFQVKLPPYGTGECILELSGTKLLDIDLVEIPHAEEDGFFYNEYPKAYFTYKPKTPLVGETVTFNATGSYDPDGLPLESYKWDFDDGTSPVTVTNPVTTYAYTEAGTYTVTLNVTDNDGLTDIDWKDIRVELLDLAITEMTVDQTMVRPGTPVHINVTILNEGSISQYFNVTTYYSNADDYIIPYNETYDSGGTIYNLTSYSSPFIWDPVTLVRGETLASGESLSIIFVWNTTGVADGTYTIWANACLVTAAAKVLPGESDPADNTYIYGDVLVTLEAPIADFTYSPSKPLVNETVTFNASASEAAPPGWIVSYTWDFGDGNVTTVLNTTDTDYWLINHTYTSVGTYEVALNITDNNGLNSTKIRQVTISVHDIAITDVSVSSTTANIGDSVSIYVKIKNLGGFDETFNVTAYYNSEIIDTQTGITLNKGAETTKTFIWDTTGVAVGDYTIKANATVVPNDANITNNVMICADNVTLTAPTDHDIAITDVSVSTTTLKVGESLSIYVTVANDGDFSETFNVTAYYNSEIIGTQTGITLNKGAETTKTFTWDTAGVAAGEYTIKANATKVEGETDVDDNVMICADNVTLTAPTDHDIAITEIWVSSTTANIGDSVSIYVKIKNLGGFDETFNVTAYYNSEIIDTQTGITLNKGAETTKTFIWDTTGVAVGDYTIKANATKVEGETDIDDNIKIYGIVRLEPPGGSSTITLQVSPATVKIGESVTINGSITPTRVGATVTIWYRIGETWDKLAIVITNENSQYSYAWKCAKAGTYDVKASWPGDTAALAAESEVKTVTVAEAGGSSVPSVILYSVVREIIVIAAAILVYFVGFRKSK